MGGDSANNKMCVFTIKYSSRLEDAVEVAGPSHLFSKGVLEDNRVFDNGLWWLCTLSSVRCHEGKRVNLLIALPLQDPVLLFLELKLLSQFLLTT